MLLAVMQGLALLVLVIWIPYYLMFMSERARLVSSIPGPIPLPFIGNVLEVGMNGIDLLKLMVELRQKYGSIFRVWLGPYLVVVDADPDHAEIFLTSKTNIKKGMQYRFLEPLLGKGILTAAGDKWRSERKLINPAFHSKILENFGNVFNSQASILTQKLKKEVEGSEFRIDKYLTLCALDIACETSMGVKMNIQDNENNEYLQAVSGFEPTILKRILQPWLYPDVVFCLTELGKQLKTLLKIMLETSEKIIQRKKSEFMIKEKESENGGHENGIGHKQRTPFLDLLLQLERDGYLTDQDIRDQVNTFLIAGHDTLAISTSFSLWLLANHPQCQERAYEELKTIFGDSGREATAEDLKDMKYLEAVIKETLRLYPPAPFLLRELEEEVKFEGCQLLPGTTIALSIYMIHRHPDYFPEPEKFDPDRFSTERAKGRHSFAFIPFSAGPRNCIGQKFAMLGMKSIISKILRTYKLLPGTTQLVLAVDILLKTRTGVHIKLEDRK